MALRIAFFGQAAFGKDVLVGLADAGHDIVGVYVPPDGGRPDPLAVEAEQRGFALLRHKRFRRKGQAIAELVEEHAKLGADLNVLAFVTAILPQQIVDAPPHGSVCFHPSLLPRFRGGAALAWQVILGEKESGVTVFRPDEGVDTGPIVVQRGGVQIEPTHTAGTLYFQHLYAMGVTAMVDAVAAVDSGTAEYVAQDESQATFQGLVGDAEARIDWSADARSIDQLVRGCDPQPGAHARLGDVVVRLFDAELLEGSCAEPSGTLLAIEDGQLRISAGGGVLGVGRARVGDGKKVAVAESGLESGQRLA
jgi:methionyl-tRNA formyltransferase